MDNLVCENGQEAGVWVEAQAVLPGSFASKC